MIYLDHAAYAWPRAQSTHLEMARELVSGIDPDADHATNLAGETAAALLNMPHSMKVRFTRSARDALSWALRALLHSGQHVIISSVEHEAVMRPLQMLQQKGVEVATVPCTPDGAVNAEVVLAAVKPHTRAIVLVHASNVAGVIQPLAAVSAIAKAKNLLLIVDAAQTVGVYPIDMTALGIDVLAFTGHKALFGPVGTGGLVAGPQAVLNEIDRAASKECILEAALPTPRALLALSEGIRYVLDCRVTSIRQHEVELTERLMAGLRALSKVSIYGPSDAEKRIGIVCFNVEGMRPREVARELEGDWDIVCRAGTHHSPDAHRTLGTWPHGAVRFSVGWGNTPEDVDYAISAVREIAKGLIDRRGSSFALPEAPTFQEHKPKRPRVLIIPQAPDVPIEDMEWRALGALADIELLDVENQAYLLSGETWGADLSHCLDMARLYARNYDLIVGECTGAFLWHTVFRLAGDASPFALIPHFNHVSPVHAYAALLSSQLTLPNDILFAGSRAACRSFAQFGFRCDPMYPLGINLEGFRPLPVTKGAIRASLGLPEDADILLYAGRLDQDKNVLELLEAFHQVAQRCRAVLAICYHFWSEHYLQQCKQRAAEIRHVRFIREPSRIALVRYYNAADLFVSTAVSDFETFGRAPVEAMACGTPPVVPAYDGFRETVPAACGMLVPTTRNGYRKWPDVSAFAQAILAMLADRQALGERSRAGVQQAQRFARQASLRAMLETYGAIGASKKSPSRGTKAPRLSLVQYPEEIRTLWSGLEGRFIWELLADFLRTGEIPVQPAPSDVQRFHEFWFAHY